MAAHRLSGGAPVAAFLAHPSSGKRILILFDFHTAAEPVLAERQLQELATLIQQHRPLLLVEDGAEGVLSEVLKLYEQRPFLHELCQLGQANQARVRNTDPRNILAVLRYAWMAKFNTRDTRLSPLLQTLTFHLLHTSISKLMGQLSSELEQLQFPGAHTTFKEKQKLISKALGTSASASLYKLLEPQNSACIHELSLELGWEVVEARSAAWALESSDRFVIIACGGLHAAVVYNHLLSCGFDCLGTAGEKSALNADIVAAKKRAAISASSFEAYCKAAEVDDADRLPTDLAALCLVIRNELARAPPVAAAVTPVAAPPVAASQPADIRKHCSKCHESFTKDSYSKNQWTKPEDIRRCKECVAKDEESSPAEGKSKKN